MKRFGWSGLLFFALILTLGKQAYAQQPRLVTVGRTTTSIGMVPLEIAVNQGYFKRRGLETQLITIRQSDVIVKATLGGEVDFMDVIPTAILASVRGLPIRTIAVFLQSAPYILIGQPGIHTTVELKGKKIGVSSLGGMSAYLMREIIARNGLNPDRDVTFLAIGGTSSRTAALFSGSIDAALVVAPDNYSLEHKGFRRLLWASDYVKYPLSGIATSADLLAKNKAWVVSFMKALLEGSRFVRENKNETVRFIKNYLAVPDEEAQRSYEFLLKEMPQKLIAEDSAIRTAMEFAGRALKMPSESLPDISKVRDWTFAESAQER